MIELDESESNSSKKRPFIGCSVIVIGFIVVALLGLGIFARSLLITLEPDEVGVVISPYEPSGYSEIPLTPGKHMLRPGERVELFKVNREVFSSSSTDCNCGSNGSNSVHLRAKDDVKIIIDYQVMYVIDSKQVLKLFQVWQHREKDGFVRPTSKQVVEEIASQYTSIEISLTKKEEIEKEIFSQLESDFSEGYLIVLEFKIEDVRLDK